MQIGGCQLSVLWDMHNKPIFTNKLDLNVRNKLIKCCRLVLKREHFGKEIGNTWKVLKWCWRRMEEISWTDRVRNEMLFKSHGRQQYRSTIKRRKANCIGHVLRSKCLLKDVTERKIERIEVTGRRGRRRSYWMTLRKGQDSGNRRKKY